MSHDLAFDYELYFGNFPAGAIKQGTQKWVGLVGAVLDQEVDLAIGSISTTKARSQVGYSLESSRSDNERSKNCSFSSRHPSAPHCT